MKILITDSLSTAGVGILRAAGHHVDERIGIPRDELKSIVHEYHVLLVRSGTRVTADVIDAAHSLLIIGRAGSGVDNIDVQAASARGIQVLNTPGGNAVAVAEHTIAMILSLARGIPFAHGELRAGTWNRKKWMGFELSGKVLGIIGFGRIGRDVAVRAHRLGMHILAHDQLVERDVIEASGYESATFENLLSRSNVITLHVPLLPSTRNLISDHELSLCKPGAYIVNCARGGILDEPALIRALESGAIAGAALDVFEEEPPPPDHPLLHHPRVVVTPHIGAATNEAQERVALLIAQQVVEALRAI